MKLICNDCKGNRTLLNDISKFPRVDRWLQGIVSNECDFKALDCTFYGKNDKEYKVISSGYTFNIDALKKEIQELPEELQFLPNDYIEIEANIAERTLNVFLYSQIL